MNTKVARNDEWKSWILFVIGCIIMIAVSINFIINAIILFIGVIFVNAGLKLQHRPELSYYISQVPVLSSIFDAFFALFRQ
jgi:hypothetical protein